MGRDGRCTPQGRLTPNLGLCKPHRGETPWLFALDANEDQLSWLFPDCLLETGRGGLGAALTPGEGELLVGQADGTYGALPIGGAGDVLGDTPAWRSGPADPDAGVPLVADCDAADELGRLSLDLNAHQLCVCLGQLHWQCVGLTD
jgi:hypothetical protein